MMLFLFFAHKFPSFRSNKFISFSLAGILGNQSESTPIITTCLSFVKLDLQENSSNIEECRKESRVPLNDKRELLCPYLAL